MSKEDELNKIVRRHYPDSQFDDCRMGCMNCDENECVNMENSRDELESDIQSFSDQQNKFKDLEIKKYKREAEMAYESEEKLRKENKAAQARIKELEEEIKDIEYIFENYHGVHQVVNLREKLKTLNNK